jgi:hypothetical protein
VQSPCFAAAFTELCAVLRACPLARATAPKRTSAAHVLAPGAMNAWLATALGDKGWACHPLTDGTSGVALRSDFRKAGLEVEVQFGNVARYAYDVLKMSIAIAQGHADVGVLVVPTRALATRIGSNLPTFERVTRELALLRLCLTIPLVVVGLGADTDPVTPPRRTPTPPRQLALWPAPPAC